MNSANIYSFKVSNRKTRKRCEITSKLTIKTPEHFIDVVQVFLLITLNIFHGFHSASIVDFEQVNVNWEATTSVDLNIDIPYFQLSMYQELLLKV